MLPRVACGPPQGPQREARQAGVPPLGRLRSEEGKADRQVKASGPRGFGALLLEILGILDDFMMCVGMHVCMGLDGWMNGWVAGWKDDNDHKTFSPSGGGVEKAIGQTIIFGGCFVLFCPNLSCEKCPS